MNPQTRPQTRQINLQLENATQVADFDEMQSGEALVEHCTIPGFLKRIPHRWHMEDIQRFGDKVQRTAEAMQIAYLTTVDRSLGIIRVFPLPLLQRIYEIQSAQFGWPALVEVQPPALGPGEGASTSHETLRAHEKVREHVKTLMAAIESTSAITPNHVQASLAVILRWIEEDMTRLRAELASAAPAR